MGRAIAEVDTAGDPLVSRFVVAGAQLAVTVLDLAHSPNVKATKSVGHGSDVRQAKITMDQHGCIPPLLFVAICNFHVDSVVRLIVIVPRITVRPRAPMAFFRRVIAGHGPTRTLGNQAA